MHALWSLIWTLSYDAQSDHSWRCRYASSRSSDSSQVAEVTEALQRQRASLDSDEGSEMDADCCGDSGELQASPYMLHWPELECLQSGWSH